MEGCSEFQNNLIKFSKINVSFKTILDNVKLVVSRIFILQIFFTIVISYF